jgi:hypothetical protein
MPKKYRVEVALVETAEDGTDSTLEAEPISEYEQEAQAREGFEEKKRKAKE